MRDLIAYFDEVEIEDLLDNLIYKVICEFMVDSKFYYCREDFEKCLCMLWEYLDKYDITIMNNNKMKEVWEFYFDNVEKE